MTKIALTPALLGGLALSAGSSVLDSYGRRQHQKRQDKANAEWLAFQNRAKQLAMEEEGQYRDVAKQALDENLDLNTQESRENIINTEADRLEGEFTGGLEGIADKVMGGAQAPGRDAVFDTAMASELASATAEARKRLAALAKTTAYGGGSQWGQGQMLSQGAERAAGDINFTNMYRQNVTDELRRKQERQPEMLEYEQSPLVPLMQAGSMIVGMGGMDPSSWWNQSLLGGGGGAPLTSIRPVARPVARTSPASMPTSTGGANPFGTKQFSFMPTTAAGGGWY